MPRQPERDSRTIIRSAPAKVNLYLELLGRRPDGFHDIETLMVAVNLTDTLTIMSAAPLNLTCSDPSLPTGSDNLVLKAAQALRKRTGVSSGAAIHLHKRIPAAAGLAGGSSDAAATLKGLNELWQTNLSNDELAEVASEIGSDVAFFSHLPAAWCTGRGEIVESVSPATRLHFVLVCPPLGLSTADVYRASKVSETPRSASAMRAAYAAGDFDGIGRGLFNRLQEPAERLVPIVRTMYEALTRQSSGYCLMSGSGSTLFAMCSNHSAAVRLAAQVRNEFATEPKPRVFVVRSLVSETTSPAT